MNLRNILTKFGVMVTILLFLAGSTFAADVFVSNTNGNDITGTGTALSPYKTIAKALAVASAGDVIKIDADTYGEGNVSVTKEVSFVALTFNALNTVTITNGMTFNPGAGKTVNLGLSSDGSQQFNLGTGGTAMVLTSGTLNITTANVVIGSGGTLTRTAGTISEVPTVTNVNIVYNGTATLTAGPELAANIGTGTLTVNITAGETLTAPNALTTAGGITVTAGNVTFGGAVTLSSSLFTNNGAASTVVFNGAVSVTGSAAIGNAINNANNGTLTLNSTLAFNHSSAAGANFTATVVNGGTGTLTLAQGFTTAGGSFGGTAYVTRINVTNSSTGTLAANGVVTVYDLTNTSTGKITLTGGSVTNTVANNAGGTLDMLASFEFAGATIGNGNGASVIKLNSNTLTVSAAGATFTNTGKVISSTAATVGSGYVNVTKAITVTGGELPNVTIAGSAGKVTLGGNVSVYGALTVASPVAGALTDGGNTITLYGNFSRTDNTPGNVVATGTLTFAGTAAQGFTPGASLTLMNLTVNKASGEVALTASVNINGNLTITSGSLNVADYNLNILGAGSVFNNSGSAYSSTGNGYVVFQNADVGGVGVLGSAATISGTGSFGNILVNLVDPADQVVTGSNVAISNGTLYLFQGDLNGAHTITFSDVLIKIQTTAANSAALTLGAGATAVAAGKTISLEYFGTTAYVAGAEWNAATATKLNNVTINTTAVAVTGYNGASTIAGTLTVASGATLTQGANIYTLSGASKVHSVLGTVGGGTLEVTGASATLNGGTATGNAASVNNLTINLANATDVFTSSNLKVIGGNLTVTKGAASITMNTVTATVTGNITLTAGSLAFNRAATTSVHGGNLVLTAGSMSYTAGSTTATSTIGGTVTLTAGNLVLGSNVTVTGATSQVAGSVDLGGNTFTQLGSGASPDYNRTGAGTVTNGTVAFNSTAAAIDLAPGTTFVLPNVMLNGTANGVTFNNSLEVAGTFTIDNAGTFSQGAGVLTLSGSAITVTNDAGAFTGAATVTGSAVTMTLGQNYAIPTLVINSSGTVTLATSVAGPTAVTLTVGTAFTLTKGIVSQGINSISVATAFTHTAGSFTQTTGYLNLNVGAPAVADGFTVDNLKIQTSAANFGTKTFTVVKNLVLANSLTTSADGKLVLGDGCLVERQGNAFVLSHVPTFGANTDLKYSTYSGAANITTAKEVPSTVRNLTVLSDAGALKTILAKSITVTGTLSLADMLDATTTASVAITMADGSTLELKVDGTSALDEDLTKAGAMNLIYNGAANTTTRELGAITSGAHPTFTGNVTFKTTVTVDAATHTFAGSLSFDNGADFNTGAQTVSLQGDVAQIHATAGFFTGTGSVWFTGATNTDLTLTQNEVLPNLAAFGLNKTNNTNTVTLKGGKTLSFTGGGALNLLTLTKGAFDTDANSVIVLLQGSLLNQPTQGFARTSGVVTGNVRKFVDRTNLQAISLIEYPTGSPDGEYRPAKFYFKSAPQSSINLTVDHQIGAPNGGNGLPLNTGSVVITNYAPFYWFIKSDISLAPSYQFDLELQAEGYNDYVLDGIQNVRMIRRDSGNVANQWRLQGSDTNYDNSTISANWPLVKVIDATGGVTSTGSIFSYSQSDKAPAFTAAGDQTVAEGSELTFNVSASDPDVGQTATLALVSKPDSSTVTIDGQTATFKWTPGNTDAGTHYLILSATDGKSTTYDTTKITVTNVNQAPMFTAEGSLAAAVNVPEGVEFTFTFAATDEPDNTNLYFTILEGPAGATLDIATGAFAWTPAFGTNGTSENLKVVVFDTDSLASDTTSSVLTITKTNRAPVIARVSSSTAATEGQEFTFEFSATDPDSADVLSYSVAEVGGNDTTAVMVGSVFTWTPNFMAAGTHQFAVTVTDNGSPNLSDTDTLSVVVANANAAPTFTAELQNQTIEFGQTITFKYEASDPDGDVLVYGFDGESPDGATLDAATGEFSWTPEANQTAIYLIKVRVGDSHGGIATTQAEITVTAITGVDGLGIPEEFALEQNYPNPFNPTTVIRYGLPEQSNVVLRVYNILGQEVATLVNTVQPAGWHEVNFNATQLSTGLYIYRIEAKDFVSIKKMMLVK